jgi:hypothetical protein
MSRVVIPQSDMFIPTGDQINKVRYRIVNENRNLYSDWSVINFVEQQTLYVVPPPDGLMPPGGNTGDIPVKTGPGDYDVGWVPQPYIPQPGTDYLEPVNNHDVPAGGATDQILTKLSAADYDMFWEDAPTSVPPGGTTGQALVKTSNVDGAVGWGTTGADPQDVNLAIGISLFA